MQVSEHKSWNELRFASARETSKRDLTVPFASHVARPSFCRVYFPGKIALVSLTIMLLFALYSTAFRSLAKATYVRRFDPPRSSM